MALPKIETPIFECVLPSNNKKVRFRPFLVKEQKLLLMATETTEVRDVIQTIKQVISNCLIDEIDINHIPIFDIEFLFLNLRARSVGEVVNVKYKCNNSIGTFVNKDGVEEEKVCSNVVDISVNVLEIQPKFGEDHTTKIQLTDKVGLMMKYPNYEMMEEITKEGHGDVVFELLTRCIDYIYDEESVYHSKDFTKKELEDFIDDLQQEQLDKIRLFFDTMPKVKKEVHFNCNKCGHHEDILIEGVQNFFA